MSSPKLSQMSLVDVQMPQMSETQIAALHRLGTGKILCGGVGTGKSRVALGYYLSREAPKALYVVTTARKRDSLDWQKEAARFGIGTEADATIAGVLKVDSWNNLEKYVEVDDAFFIFDEQRLVGAGAWTKAFLKIAKRNAWILLSATPGDTWLDYIPVLVANGHYKNRTQFKQEHVVYSSHAKFPKVERYLGQAKLVKLRKELLVEMPYERTTTRHMHTIEVDVDQDLMDQVVKRKWHVYETRPLRDVAEFYSVMKRVAYSDASRLAAVRSLMAVHPRLIVFYQYDYELLILRQLASNAPLAEWNGHKHEDIPATETWIYLVQYTAGAEAWECVSTNAMVFWSLPYSYKIFEQAQGRIDRMNTPYLDLQYYALQAKTLIDTAVQRSLSRKQDFHESRTKIKW